VHIGLIPEQSRIPKSSRTNFSGDIAGADVAGQRVIIEGRIFDGAAMWQRTSWSKHGKRVLAGRYNHPADTQDKALDHSFRGWARTGTDLSPDFTRSAPSSREAWWAARVRKAMAPHVNFLCWPPRGIKYRHRPRDNRRYFGYEEAANSERSGP